MHRPSPPTWCRPRCGVLLGAGILGALTLAACGSSSGSGGSPAESADARLAHAGTTVDKAITTYLAAAQQCKTATGQNPVVCLETADRTLGGEIHDYANVLAVGHGFHVSAAARNSAQYAGQTLANSLEILGDAEPTQANYDQVLNTFNLNSAITSFQKAVTKVQSQLG